MWLYLLVAAAAYLVGSVPTGLLVGRLTRGVDVREYGSGNIGAANALRTLGTGAFVAVFALDLLKGLVPVLLAGQIAPDPWLRVAAGLGAVGGHNWSLFLKGAGGRGVSTGIGGLYGMTWAAALLVTAVTVAVMVRSRYISLGSVVGAAFAMPLMVVAVWGGYTAPEYLAYALPAAAAIIVQHRGNIERLRAGTERRAGGPPIVR